VPTELVFERNISCKSQFSRWKRHTFIAIGPSRWVDEAYSSKKKSKCIRRNSICDIVSIWELRVFWRVYFLQSMFSQWSKAHFVPNRALQLLEDTHVSPERKPCVWEAGAPSPLFPCDDCVTFWQEYFLQILDCKVEKESFSSKYDYSDKGKKHMYFSKENHLC
jgi:hypothetical protein